jgi:Tol biopolymer transport system component
MAHSRVWTAALLALLAGCGGSSSYSGGGEPGDTAGADIEPRSGILFVRDGDIFLIQPDGTDETPLTRTRRSESNPVWSPDGRRIAFVRHSDAEGYPDEGAEVYVINADGSGEVNVSRHEADDRDPAWHPDGRRLAFVSDRDDNEEIYLVNADGSGLKNLTDDPAANDHDPAFGPDGRLAFVRIRTVMHEVPVYALAVMNADGSGVRTVRELTCCFSDPVFSPLGDRIAAVAWDDFEVPSVFALDGEMLAIACDGEGFSSIAPAFGPDGRSVVYQRAMFDDERRVDHYDLARMAPDANGTFQGGGCTPLTRDPANELNPTFGPGGSRIAFTRVEGSIESLDLATAEVWVMDADGANPARLTAGVLGDWR